MSIVSSSAIADPAQQDGRFWVHETHVDNINLQWHRDYLAAPGTDYDALLPAHASAIAAELEATEIADNLLRIQASGANAVLTTNYTTLSPTMTAARALFSTAVGPPAVALGDWFNTQSFVALQQAFGFANVAAYNAFKAQYFTPHSSTATSVRAATGA